MELHEKLQGLRKKEGLTQEELARKLYVSRTAVSKWESGRGYPSIDSLKAIAGFYGLTVDALLSGEELLQVAEEQVKQEEKLTWDVVFGLLDCGMAIFFFLPLFGQNGADGVQGVSLLALTGVQPWLKVSYFAVVIGMVLTGILILALQNNANAWWTGRKHGLSMACHVMGMLLFILSRQPYASALTFVFLSVKVFMILKRK